jgi:hypothetical protein
MEYIDMHLELYSGREVGKRVPFTQHQSVRTLIGINKPPHSMTIFNLVVYQ